MNREKIIAAQSHISDPSGTRYGIHVEPHQFDVEEKHSTLRAEVYPCTADGSRLRRCSNEIWSFRFVVESNGIAQVYEQKKKYWTLYYNPIIHAR
jgi:hypothetical protein